MKSFIIEFVTPLFSRGAYQERPEIRAASIRGQLHWWFRALSGGYSEEQEIFGSVHGTPKSSRVVVRTTNVVGGTQEYKTLAHKDGGQAAPKNAYRIGSRFELQILFRGKPISDQLKGRFQRALEGWLLMGTLGLRGTRAAGSFSWNPMQESGLASPDTFAAYEARCEALVNGTRMKFALLKTVYERSEDARYVVSDTLGGKNDRAGDNALERLSYPLGKVFDGRKTSPLRFKIIALEGTFRIAAIWDSRSEVTGNSISDLEGVIRLLKDKKEALGGQLYDSSLFVGPRS